MDFTEEQIQTVWNKGLTRDGFSASMYRFDECGAIMKKTDYGNRNSNMGWEVDHKVPISKGGSDNIDNLQPLQWENNVSKSNGNDSFCAVRFEEFEKK